MWLTPSRRYEISRIPQVNSHHLRVVKKGDLFNFPSSLSLRFFNWYQNRVVGFDYLVLQDAGIEGSPNKEDLGTATPDQELDARNSGVALLALVVLLYVPTNLRGLNLGSWGKCRAQTRFPRHQSGCGRGRESGAGTRGRNEHSRIW